MKRGLFALLVLVLVVLVVAKIFVLEIPVVQGNDMAPAVQSGDRLLAYRLDTRPGRGDLVLFEVPASRRLLIRRVVGLPGERIGVTKEVPRVDGKPALRRVLGEVVLLETEDGRTRERSMRLLEERPGDSIRYQVLKDPRRRSVDYTEITLEDAYFVMSDNRNHGADSRTFGPVPSAKIRAVITHRLSAGPGTIRDQGSREGFTSLR